MLRREVADPRVTEKYSGGNIDECSEANQGELGAEEGRQDVGDSQGGSTAVSGSKSVGDDLHRETTGDSGTVGGAAEMF